MRDFEQQEVNFRVYDGLVMRRTDPYGYWMITDEGGKTPKELSGKRYTDTYSAINAIETYNHLKSVTKVEKKK